MKRLFLSICLSLLPLFSVKATQSAPDSLSLVLLQLERASFESQDPVQANMVLLKKATLLYDASCFDEAIATLDRIALYALPSEDAAAAEELRGRILEESSSRKETGALKTAGYVALGAGALAFGVWQVVSGQWITGYLVGAVGAYHCWYLPLEK